MVSVWGHCVFGLESSFLHVDLFSQTSWQMKVDSHLQFPGKKNFKCLLKIRRAITHIVMHGKTLTYIHTHSLTQAYLHTPVWRQWASPNVSNLIQKRLITYVSPYKRAHLFSLSRGLFPPLLFLCPLLMQLCIVCCHFHLRGLMIDLFKINTGLSAVEPSAALQCLPDRERAFQSEWILGDMNSCYDF